MLSIRHSHALAQPPAGRPQMHLARGGSGGDSWSGSGRSPPRRLPAPAGPDTPAARPEKDCISIADRATAAERDGDRRRHSESRRLGPRQTPAQVLLTIISARTDVIDVRVC